MIRICVAGGTGQTGGEVVRQALELGYEVSAFSRRPPSQGAAGYHDGARYFPADATTGVGLAQALADADVVIDCLEGRSRKAIRDFADGGSHLLAAAQAAGLRKAVMLSIINCDQCGLGFYRSKADKERRYARSELETVVVRATQFHSLLAGMFSAGAAVRLIPVIRGASFQPISPSEAAAALLEAGVEDPSAETHRMRTVGGPEVLTMKALASIWKQETGARGRILELPVPGSMGRYLREGRNLMPEQRFGSETFSGWLAKNADSL